jgi:hypothetical protein
MSGEIVKTLTLFSLTVAHMKLHATYLKHYVGWILGYHSALTQPLQLGRGGEPTPPTCAYIYHSVDLLYSGIESSFSTDSHESGLRSVYSESAVAR